MPSADPERDGVRTREAILEVAHRLYLEEGLPGLSMRKIAKEVGVSATALYRHFEDKESMLLSLVKKGSFVFLDCLSDGLHGSTPYERLRITGLGYLRFATEYPQYYRILFMAPKEHLGLARLSAQATEDFAPTFTFLMDRVRECMSVGRLPVGDVESVSLMIWANVHGLCSLRLAGHLAQFDEGDFRYLYTEALDAQLRGLQVPP